MAASGHFETTDAVSQQCVIVFGSRLVFLARIALFNLTAHELHELCYDIGLLLREALDRLRVRLNMYLVVIINFCKTHLFT